MKFSGRVFVGLLILVFGLALLADNLNLFDFDTGIVISSFIAIFIMSIGIRLIFSRHGFFFIIFGLLITSVGFNIINENFDLFDFDTSIIWSIFWPVIIIVFGLKLIFNFNNKSKVALLSGVELGDRYWKLEDNSYSAIMGGFDLNLVEADIKDGETTIKLSAIMGGIEVYVPDNVNVICSGKVLLGGIEFLGKGSGGLISTIKKEYNVNSTKTIILDCNVLMGGIEIKVRQPFIND